MEKTYSRQDFDSLDFDDKCVVMEMLLTEDYFTGQGEIDFYHSVNEKTGNLNPTPPEIKIVEDIAFEKLIVKLTDKLFKNKTTIELDLDKMLEE